jgi:peptide/nickel transport system substrate-binding protein
MKIRSTDTFGMAKVLAVAATCLSLTSLQANAENVLRWASQGDALTMDPMSASEAPTIAAARKVYDSLVYPDKDVKFGPGLAVSWDATGPTTWEFKLREGVKFHDGSDFTAEDVKFSVERAQSGASDYKGYIESVLGVTILDPMTVQFETTGPNPILPNQLATIFIMSKAWSEANNVTEPQDRSAGEETFAVRNAMGTGPYKIVLREPGIRTILEKNPDWWGAGEYPNQVDRIEFTPIANPATRVAALLSGEIDFLLDPPTQDLARIENTPGLTVKQVAQVRTIFLGMNQGRDQLLTTNVEGNPFKDIRVRQAVYHAIDVEAIRRKIMRGYAIPAGVVTSPAVHGYTEELDQRLAYDPDLARSLLAEAGYADGFSIQLDCPNDRYINDEAICQAAVSMLAKVGIDVSLSAISKTLHFPKIHNRETDFYMLGWGVPTLDSHFAFSYLFKSADQGWNGSGWVDASVDDMTDAIEIEIDLDKRDAMIADLWKKVDDNVNYIPLHHQVIVWAMRDTIDMPMSADNDPRFRYLTYK